MKLNRIMEAIKATGAEARETAYSAGLYYDGTQHGELIPCIFVSVSIWEHGAAAAGIDKQILKSIKRYKGIVARPIHSHGFYSYFVMGTEDSGKADYLQAKADVFLEAFHQERHRQRIAGEEDNAEKAIQAGHNALLNAGYSLEDEDIQLTA